MLQDALRQKQLKKKQLSYGIGVGWGMVLGKSNFQLKKENGKGEKI